MLQCRHLSNSTDGCAGDTQAVSSSVSGSTGAAEVIQGKSSYQVPSEMVGNTSDASIGTEMDAYHDFMPMYQEATKLVDGAGLRCIARKHFHSMLIELKHEAYLKNGQADGMQSGPQISKKREAKRKRAMCSPTKK